MAKFLHSFHSTIHHDTYDSSRASQWVDDPSPDWSVTHWWFTSYWQSADHYGCADRDVNDAPSSFCCSQLLLVVVCVGVVLIELVLEVPLSLFCGSLSLEDCPLLAYWLTKFVSSTCGAKLQVQRQTHNFSCNCFLWVWSLYLGFSLPKGESV